MIENLHRAHSGLLELVDNPVLVLKKLSPFFKILYLLDLFFQLGNLLFFISLFLLPSVKLAIQCSRIPPAPRERNQDHADAEQHLCAYVILRLGRSSFGSTGQEVNPNHLSPTALSANPTPTAAEGPKSASTSGSMSQPVMSISAKGSAISTGSCILSASC